MPMDCPALLNLIPAPKLIDECSTFKVYQYEKNSS
jgi:hypothetical protein